MNNKKKPVRKCIGCRRQDEKSAFLRVVRTNQGEILLDFTGKANGRGAYLCKDVACFEKARKEKSFQRAFKCQIPEELFDEVLARLISVTKN